jgi:polyhydroxybutyrate depolymerase
MRWLVHSLLFVAFAACSSSMESLADSGAQDTATTSVSDASALMEDASAPVEGVLVSPGDAGDPLIAARPYRVRVPRDYQSLGPLPLVVLLHGYGANATGQEAYFALGPQVHERRFLLALPEGTRDPGGRQFWNATDACCNFFNAPVDDVAYLRALIVDMKARYNVDANRVYVIGHSNGGFMALRMACEMSDAIAAVMSLAGAGFNDAMRCVPTRTVHVLQVHGDMDQTVLFGGGAALVPGGRPYPGAERTVADWAERNGCAMTRTSAGADLDLDRVLPGAETTREAHMGCRAGGSAELWRIRGRSHIPTFSATWAPTIIDWLYAHARGM